MLHAWNSIIPAMPVTPDITAGLKEKRVTITRNKWVWEAFQTSARGDQAVFYHWSKSENADTEYPWAKFNTCLEKMMYTDDEYEAFLAAPGWTRHETDRLMEICYKFDLRWPVIFDRYPGDRRLEDLQARFFDVISKLKASKATPDAFSSTKSDPTIQMNLEYERNRRQQQEAYFLKYSESL